MAPSGNIASSRQPVAITTWSKPVNLAKPAAWKHAVDPPWPGFKDLPDDAGEAIILPRDLERACKVGEDFLKSRFGLFGIATMGSAVYLGLGSELVTARTVGRIISAYSTLKGQRLWITTEARTFPACARTRTCASWWRNGCRARR
jgi:hypothetical protein